MLQRGQSQALDEGSVVLAGHSSQSAAGQPILPKYLLLELLFLKAWHVFFMEQQGPFQVLILSPSAFLKAFPLTFNLCSFSSFGTETLYTRLIYLFLLTPFHVLIQTSGFPCSLSQAPIWIQSDAESCSPSVNQAVVTLPKQPGKQRAGVVWDVLLEWMAPHF